MDEARPGMDGQLRGLQARLDQLSAQLEHLTRTVAEIRQLVGPFGAPFGEDRLLVQTIHGQKYVVEADDLVMTPQLVVYRQWEAELSAFMTRLLTPDSVFVDVGANFGYFTCLAGSRIGASGRGRVIAVEPNPAVLALLEANVLINWSMCPIEIVRVAAGSAAGRALLGVPTQRSANAALLASGIAGGAAIEVEVRPLDDIAASIASADLVKIDVEGHETAVLMGARKLIARSPAITVVIEWSMEQMREAGYQSERLLALIRQLGLSVFALSADVGADRALSDAEALSTPYATLVLRPTARP